MKSRSASFSRPLGCKCPPHSPHTLRGRFFFFFFFLFCHLTSTCEMFVAELTSVCQHIVAPGDILAPARHRPSYPPPSFTFCVYLSLSFMIVYCNPALIDSSRPPPCLSHHLSLSSVISCSCVLISACLLVCLCM